MGEYFSQSCFTSEMRKKKKELKDVGTSAPPPVAKPQGSLRPQGASKSQKPPGPPAQENSPRSPEKKKPRKASEQPVELGTESESEQDPDVESE
jgi:hypothetical protein